MMSKKDLCCFCSAVAEEPRPSEPQTNAENVRIANEIAKLANGLVFAQIFLAVCVQILLALRFGFRRGFDDHVAFAFGFQAQDTHHPLILLRKVFILETYFAFFTLIGVVKYFSVSFLAALTIVHHVCFTASRQVTRVEVVRARPY